MRNNSLAPALIGSALLHVAVFGFALWKFPNETRQVLNAVPVQIVSEMPAMAPAPASEPEMNEAPEPVVEEAPPEPTPPTPEPPKPEPKPTPPKPEPKPVPPKPEPKPAPPKPEPKPAPPKPEPKPTPPKPEPKPAAPDKAPVKKPTKEADIDPLAFVKDMSRSSSKPKSSQAATPAKGTSRSGPATQDLGPAQAALVAKLMRLWSPNCGVEGADELKVTVQFSLSEAGRVIRGPTLVDRRGDPVWQAAATRAISAVKRGEPYQDLPDAFYSEAIEVTFDGEAACR